MPVAEIDFPGPNGNVGPSFPAGGVFDFTRSERKPEVCEAPAPTRAAGLTRVPKKILCRLHDAGGNQIAITLPTADLTTPTGPWSVNFTTVPGPYPRLNHKITSYIVFDDGSDSASQIVTGITISDGGAGGGGGVLVVEELP